LEYLWESTSVAACSTAGFLAFLYHLMISSVAVGFFARTAFFVEAAVFSATVGLGAFTAFFVEAAVFLATVLFLFGAI